MQLCHTGSGPWPEQGGSAWPASFRPTALSAQGNNSHPRAPRALPTIGARQPAALPTRPSRWLTQRRRRVRMSAPAAAAAARRVAGRRWHGHGGLQMGCRLPGLDSKQLTTDSWIHARPPHMPRAARCILPGSATPQLPLACDSSRHSELAPVKATSARSAAPHSAVPRWANTCARMELQRGGQALTEG